MTGSGVKPGSASTEFRASRRCVTGFRAILAATILAVAISPALARFQADQSGPTGPLAPAPRAPGAVPNVEEKALGAPGPSRPPDHAPSGRTGKATPAAAPKSWLSQTVLSLGGVLALAALAAGAFRFLSKGQGGIRASLGAGGRSPAGVLEILGRYPVGRGATLVLLKFDRRVLLLSQSAGWSGARLGGGGGFQTLCEISDAEEVASILVKARDADGDSVSERFRAILGRFDRTMDDAEDASGRRSTATRAGDRAELWDERNPIPVVDLTRQPGPPDRSAAGSLRRRLASIRWPGLNGGEGGPQA